MPRLCVLTQYFPPEMGAPQARLFELGEQLVDLGWSVEVLTALPNYPEGRVRKGYSPTRPVVETIGRLRTVRVPLFPAQTGFAKRLACYGSFAASASALGPRYCTRPDLLFVESPPLFIGWAAQALSFVWRCPYVFNVSDLWPESAIHMGVLKPGVASYLAERLERSLYVHAVGVTGQSSEIIAGVQKKAPEVPVETITNGVDPERWGKSRATDEARQMLGTEPGPVFVFAGLFGLAQGLDQILDLARSLPSQLPGRFVLVGDGPVRQHLSDRVARENLVGRVRILPAQPREAMPALLGAADAAVITLGLDLPGAVPSKIYEAMASELPILLVASGEPAQRVEQKSAGLCVPPKDMGALRLAFERLSTSAALREEMGHNGRRAAETTYDRRQIAARLDRFLCSCLGADRGKVATHAHSRAAP